MRRRLLLVVAGVAVLAVAGFVVVRVASDTGFDTRPADLPSTLAGDQQVGQELELRPDGVGTATFGQSFDDAIATMSELFGTPVEDVMQPCANGQAEMRWVGWGSLTIVGAGDAFVGYVQGIYFGPTGLEIASRTVDGAVLRMPEEELRGIYGDRLVVRPIEGFGPDGGFEFGVDGYLPSNPLPEGLGGYLEQSPDATIVVTFNGGAPC